MALPIDYKVVHTDITNCLKKSGYSDTTKMVFTDDNNILYIQPKLTNVVNFSNRKNYQFNYYGFNKFKLDITWYLRNNYSEIVDSVVTTSYSGEFAKYDINKLTSDALYGSYLSLFNNTTFNKNLRSSAEQESIPEKPLKLSTKNIIKDVSHTNIASVIVKNGSKHGSGFAISEDGYILSNYHVIAGKYIDKFEKIEIILYNGETHEAEVIRYNKAEDLVLLKVNVKFDKVFGLPKSKSYNNMEEIFTIGAPRSIELGQSLSSGIISSERNIKNTQILQLNMSVNSGNSGGPVFDKNGNLHGVIVAKLFGFATEGICFAIPAHNIRTALNLDIN
jgi:serine protease Do